jgi:CHAT domain-containing protein
MSSLSFDSRFVNFAKLPVYDFEKSFGADDAVWGDERYVAWVVPPVGEGTIQFVDLGLAGPIDQAITKVREQMTKAPSQLSKRGEKKLENELLASVTQLSKLVFQPIAAHLEDASQLLISPDGELWSIPFEILRQQNKYLIESKQIRYLTSGRELVRKIKPYSAISDPVVFADPDYDLSPEKVKGATEKQFALRNTNNMHFPALGFSGIEAEAITPLVEEYTKTSSKPFLAAEAQEANFKNLHRPRVLAISTHGFFNSDSEKVSNPLLRCGLALAGANNRQKAMEDGKEDGILTGLEIVGTDLRGTELVVLSACETGLGEVTSGEGVAGLRQAFQLAGAQSVVSSLWQVEDGETARLMKLFFENLADGKSKSQALRQAQLSRIKARRARHGAAHPFFWAAFTLTGQD